MPNTPQRDGESIDCMWCSPVTLLQTRVARVARERAVATKAGQYRHELDPAVPGSRSIIANLLNRKDLRLVVLQHLLRLSMASNSANAEIRCFSAAARQRTRRRRGSPSTWRSAAGSARVIRKLEQQHFGQLGTAEVASEVRSRRWSNGEGGAGKFSVGDKGRADIRVEAWWQLVVRRVGVTVMAKSAAACLRYVVECVVRWYGLMILDVHPASLSAQHLRCPATLGGWVMDSRGRRFRHKQLGQHYPENHLAIGRLG
ncbi:hypothetical protein B0H14DRAFT_2574122 [Mycena olivaceomarginata]|nr:hypothetical protein B0H14DRAFT_2574122 [Mycena olivaceomarginata]